MIKNILFDLNKVLIVPINLNDEYIKKLGISQSKFWEYSKKYMEDYIINKINLDDLLSSLIKINNLDIKKLSIAKKLHEKNLSLRDGMSELLILLSKKYRLILAAGEGRESFDTKLRKFNLKSYFSEVYVTCEIGVKKNNIKYYKEILKKSNLSPKETLFIDDQKPFIDTANKLGIKTILFENLAKLRNDLKNNFNIIT